MVVWLWLWLELELELELCVRELQALRRYCTVQVRPYPLTINVYRTTNSTASDSPCSLKPEFPSHLAGTNCRVYTSCVVSLKEKLNWKLGYAF